MSPSALKNACNALAHFSRQQTAGLGTQPTEISSGVDAYSPTDNEPVIG
jgi:hypothetical protein